MTWQKAGHVMHLFAAHSSNQVIHAACPGAFPNTTSKLNISWAACMLSCLTCTKHLTAKPFLTSQTLFLKL